MSGFLLLGSYGNFIEIHIFSMTTGAEEANINRLTFVSGQVGTGLLPSAGGGIPRYGGSCFCPDGQVP